jgi:hypothetical protein
VNACEREIIVELLWHPEGRVEEENKNTKWRNNLNWHPIVIT